jgi:predicted ABC-type ATPase
LAPEEELLTASRLFLNEIHNRASKRENFAFETTLSGRSYLKLIKQLQTDGWRVELIYLALQNCEASRLRVAERVAHGGHNIPFKDIKRRFPRSLKNLLNEFSQRVNHCQCYLNADELPVLVFEQERQNRTIHQLDIFNHLLKESGHDH